MHIKRSVQERDSQLSHAATTVVVVVVYTDDYSPTGSRRGLDPALHVPYYNFGMASFGLSLSSASVVLFSLRKRLAWSKRYGRNRPSTSSIPPAFALWLMRCNPMHSRCSRVFVLPARSSRAMQKSVRPPSWQPRLQWHDSGQ